MRKSLFLVEELQVGGIALVEVCCEPESSLSVESLRRGHRYIGVVKDVKFGGEFGNFVRPGCGSTSMCQRLVRQVVL